MSLPGVETPEAMTSIHIERWLGKLLEAECALSETKTLSELSLRDTPPAPATLLWLDLQGNLSPLPSQPRFSE